MVPNTYSPNLSIAWWSLFTALWSRGQGLSPVESVWLSLQEIRNNKQTQTESNWNSVPLASLRRQGPCHPACTFPNLGYWASCSSDTLVSFQYIRLFFFFLKERKEVVKDINSMDTWLYSKPLSVTLWDRQGRDLFPCSVRDYRSQNCVLWPRHSVTGHVELKSQT